MWNKYYFLYKQLLLGALPIETEIHKRQLSLLYSILQSDNDIVKGILNRQLAVYNDDPDSFCGRISSILQTYNLPSIEELLGNLPIKSEWKFSQNRCKYLLDRCYAYWYWRPVYPVFMQPEWAPGRESTSCMEFTRFKCTWR